MPAEQIGKLHAGAPVEFTVTGYAGRAFQRDDQPHQPAADPATRQVRVYAAVPNSGSELVSGLYAEGRVASETRTGLTLPRPRSIAAWRSRRCCASATARSSASRCSSA